MNDDESLRWRTIAEEPSADYAVFRVYRRDAAHPETGRTHRLSILECPDWVNVIALTPDDRVLLVRQFRHGTGQVTLEIPGGVVDPGESALAAARRELREETGHEAGQWLELGVVEPNPALQSNRCTCFLALDARPAGAPDPDSGEAIRVEALTLSDIRDAVCGGRIRHALVVCAFLFLVERAGGWRRPG